MKIYTCNNCVMEVTAEKMPAACNNCGAQNSFYDTEERRISEGFEPTPQDAEVSELARTLNRDAERVARDAWLFRSKLAHILQLSSEVEGWAKPEEKKLRLQKAGIGFARELLNESPLNDLDIEVLEQIIAVASTQIRKYECQKEGRSWTDELFGEVE